MATTIVATPDGKHITVEHPAGAAENDILLYAQNQYSLDPSIAYDPTTALGRAGEFLKGIPRGFVSSLAMGAEGLGQIADTATDLIGLDSLIDEEDENALIYGARSVRGAIDDMLAPRAGYRDLWTTKFGDALGSLGSFFTPVGGAKLLGLTGKVAKNLPPVLFASGVGAGEQSQRIQMAREQGLPVSEAEQHAAIFGGSLLGITELAPVHMILRGLPKEALGQPFFKTLMPRLQSALASGSVEAVQEVTAGVLQDLTERNLYNPELPVGQSAWDEMTLGGAAGATADLVLNAVIGKRAAGLSAQQIEMERDLRRAERERLAEAAKQFPPAPGGPPGGTPLLLPYLPEESADPKDPAGTVRAMVQRIVTNSGENFPLNTRFSSNETQEDGTTAPGLIVRDEQGNQYGPTFEAPDQAYMFAEALNEEVVERTLARDIDLAISQSVEPYDSRDNLLLRVFGRRLFHPKENSFTREQIDYAAETTLENGYAHESLSAKEALDAGIKPADMTASQRINARRIQQGRPEVRLFSVPEARAILKDNFGRLSDFNATPLGANETFSATMEGTKPVVKSNYGEIIRTRRTTPKEQDKHPDWGTRTSFRNAKDAKRYADYLNSKRNDLITRSDLLADEEIDASKIRDMLRTKNIASDIHSREIKAISRAITGSNKSIDKLSAGERAMLYYKLRSLPQFDKPTRLPDFSKRPYSAAHHQAALQEILRRVSDPIEAAQGDARPSREMLEKTAGALPESAYNTLLRDIAQDRSVQSAVRQKQEETRQRVARETELTQRRLREVESVTNAVRERFRGFGLERVGTHILDYIRQARRTADGAVETGERVAGAQTEGAYSKALNDIFIAVESLKAHPKYREVANEPEPTRLQRLNELAIDTLGHEILHPIRQADLLEQKEWNLLEKIARTKQRPDGKTYTQWAESEYQNRTYTPVELMEEGIAELIRDGLAGRVSIGGKPKNLMQRIGAYLRSMVGLKESTGYRSFDEIVAGIQSGEVGARPTVDAKGRDVVRNLVETERAIGIVPERVGVPAIGVTIPKRKTEAAEGQSQADWAEGRRAQQALTDYSDMYFAQRGEAAYRPARLNAVRRELVRPNRTRAAIAFIDPNDFIKAATPPIWWDVLDSQIGQLDVPQLRREKETPHLLVQKLPNGEFQVWAHNGRHRMGAMAKDGIKRAPVVILAADHIPTEQVGRVLARYGENIKGHPDPRMAKYYDEPTTGLPESGVLFGQEVDAFYQHRANNDFELNYSGLLDITPENWPLIQERFGKLSPDTTAEVGEQSEVPPEQFRIFPDLSGITRTPKAARPRYNIPPPPKPASKRQPGDSFLFARRSGEGLPIKTRVPDASELEARYLLPIGDIEQSLFDLLQRTSGKPTVRQLAKIKGAPKPRRIKNANGDWVPNPEDRGTRPVPLDTLRAALRESMRTEDYLEWHRLFGEGLSALVGEANMPEMSGIFGITSAQNTVEQNLAEALHIMMLARQFNPVEETAKFKKAVRLQRRPGGQRVKITDGQIDRIVDIYRKGYMSGGLKTSTLAQNITAHALNQFNPFSVQDVHMARLFGWKRAAISDKTGERVDTMESPDDLGYRYAQFLTTHLALEEGLDPQQVQAALWFYAKNKLSPKKGSSTGTWASARLAAAKEINQLQQMVAAGTFDQATPLTPALRTADTTPSNRIENKSVGFSNYFQNPQLEALAAKTAPRALLSAVPGGGWRFPAGTPYMTKVAYNRGIVERITDSSGQIPFVREMGIPHEVTISTGSYEGLEPNIIVRLKGGTQEQADFIAVVLGDALLQDAALSVVPNYSGTGQQMGLAVRKADGSAFTDAELQTIATAVNPANSATGNNFTALEPDMLVFIDGRQYNDGYDAVTMFPEFQQSLQASLPADMSLTFEAFKQDSNYHARTEYQRTARSLGDKIRRPLSPDLHQRLDATLYQPVWDYYQSFTQRVGINTSGVTQPRFVYDPDHGRNQRFEPWWRDSDIVFSRRTDPGPAESTARPGGRLPDRTGASLEGVTLGSRKGPDARQFVGVHFGRVPASILEADRYGSGIRGEERKRLSYATDPRIKRRVYFYIEPDYSRLDDYMARVMQGQVNRPEPGLGVHVHVQRFNNILDVDTPASHRFRGLDPNEFESAVIDAGYDGYAAPTQGVMVILDHDVPTGYLGTTQALEERGIPIRRDRTAVLREFDPDQVQAIVAENILAEAQPSLHPPVYSASASHEAQYVARHPDAGEKPREGDLQLALRPATLSPAAAAVVSQVAPDAPLAANPHEVMQRTLGALDAVPGGFEYWLTRFKQEAINRYARLERLNVTTHLRHNLADSSSIAAQLHADRAMGLLSAVIRYGVPVYENGWLQVKGANETGGFMGLLDVMRPLYSKEHGDLTRLAKSYAMTRRAYRLDIENKKVPVDPQQRAIIEAEVERFTDANGNNPIREWYGNWQTFNEHVITMMQKAGVLTDETANLWRTAADYYPFYRVAEGGGKLFYHAQKVFGGMTGAVSLKRLKGGEAPINMDMIEAITLNVSAAVQMSLKNIAQQRTVRDLLQLGLAEEVHLPPGAQAPVSVVEFRVNGKIRTFAIHDPLVYESMLPLEGTEVVSFIKHTFGAPATFLREMVTRDPGFMLVNLLRDSLSSYATSGARLTPIISTFKGLFDGVERLEKLGVVGGYDLSNDPDNIKEFFDDLIRKEGLVPGGPANALNMFRTLWNALGRGTTASDAATRNAVFDDVFARTGNVAEAAFQAMEVINFGRRGRNPLVRILTAVVPFLNARFQGIDVFWRAYTGQYTANKELNRTRIIASAVARGSLLLAATALYYFMVSDDDQYKEAPEYLKENNWLIPTAWGVPITLPIPFEVGLLFKTIPEAILAAKFGDKSGQELRGTLARGIGSTLEISPFQIQFVGPLMEAAINYNQFTGRQIVPQYMVDGIEPGLQREVWSSELAKAIGARLNISPMKIDHAVTGYLGTMGTYLYSLLDVAMKSPEVQGDSRVTPPTPRFYDYPIIKRFFGSLHDSGLKEDFYELYKEVKRVHDTVLDLNKSQRGDELLAYVKGREQLLGMWGTMNNLKEQVDKIRRMRERIMESDLPPEIKRQQVDQLEANMNALLKVAMPQLKAVGNLPFYRPTYQ